MSAAEPVTVDELLLDLHAKGYVLTFLQELRDGSWHAAARHGQHDYERGTGMTAAAALSGAIDNADAQLVVPFREIWQAARAPETRPLRVAPMPAPAAETADVFE